MQHINFKKYDYLLSENRYVYYWIFAISIVSILFFLYGAFVSEAHRVDLFGLRLSLYYLYPLIANLLVFFIIVHDAFYGRLSREVNCIYIDELHVIIKTFRGDIVKLNNFKYYEEVESKRDNIIYYIVIYVEGVKYYVYSQKGTHEELKRYLDVVIKNREKYYGCLQMSEQNVKIKDGE